MRLVVLAHALYVAGGQSVAYNIIRALMDCADVENLQLLVFVPENERYRTLHDTSSTSIEFVKIRTSVLERLIFDEYVLARKIKRWNTDAIFALGNFGVRRHNALQVTLFHNPNRVYPELYFQRSFATRLRVLLNDYQIKRTLQVTQKVYCQTDTMSERFKSKYRYGNLGWLPNAVSSTCLEQSSSLSLPFDLVQKLPTTGSLLFCLTRYYPHKNVELILETFIQYRELLGDVGVLFTLSESDHPNVAILLERIRKAGLDDRLVNLGAVPQEWLAALYAKSDALLLPTLLESFSGTYAEAMQFGKTILTSDLDFAREICGSTAIYFDPYRTESLKDAILTLAGDAEAKALGLRHGQVQLKKCTRPWKASVQEVVRDLRELVS